jgi:predicted Fe-S protein YdhL (DUF1289 family)
MLVFGGEVKQEFLDGRGVLQDQVYIRALAVDFFISLLNTVDQWVDRTRAEVTAWESMSLEERNDRGMGILASLPVATPESPSLGTPRPPRSQTRTASRS